MRRLLLLLLLSATPVLAQNTVTGTIVDTNGNPYANGTASAFLVVGTGQNPGTPINTTTNSAGLFTMTLANGNYVFTICASPTLLGVPATNPTPKQVCFNNVAPITITTSTDISTTLNAVAPVLGPSGSGSGNCGTNGLFMTNNGLGAAPGSTYNCSTPLTLSSNTVGAPNLTTNNTYFGTLNDYTGNLSVRENTTLGGPTPWVDATSPLFGGRSISYSGTASCNGTFNITTSPALSTAAVGDGITVYGCGSSYSGPTAPTPTVTSIEATGYTVPDQAPGVTVTGSGTYHYKMLARPIGALGMSAPGTVVTITNGPSALGPIPVSVTSWTLIGTTLVITASNHGLAQGADFHFTGASISSGPLLGYGVVPSGRFQASSVTTNTITVNNFPTFLGVTSTGTGGTITYMNGNQLAWTPAADTQYLICAERPGDSSYHLIGLSLPTHAPITSVSGYFTDWGSTITTPRAFASIADSSCSNSASTPNNLTSTITAINGTTVTLANSASQTSSGNGLHHDNAPNISAASTTTAFPDNVPLFIPNGSFDIYSPLILNNRIMLQEGQFNLYETMTYNGHPWSGVYSAASQDQFQWAGGANVNCLAAYPCIYSYSGWQQPDHLNINGQNTGSYLGWLNDSGNAGFVCDSDNWQFPNSLNAIGILFTSSVQDGVDCRNILVDTGPQNQVDATWTPGTYIDRSVNVYSFKGYKSSSFGSIYAIGGLNGQAANIDVQYDHGQDNELPLFTFEPSTGGQVLILNLCNMVPDTTSESVFANLSSSGLNTSQISLTACNWGSGGTEVGGVPLNITGDGVHVTQSSDPTGSSSLGLNNFVVGHASLFVNDTFDSGANSASPRQYASSFGPFISQTIGTGMGAPVLATPTLSAGGSVPTGTWYYTIIPQDWNGAWGAPSIQQAINVTPGNQTVNLSYGYVLGAKCYNVWRSTNPSIYSGGYNPTSSLVPPSCTTANTFADSSATTAGGFQLPTGGAAQQTGIAGNQLQSPKIVLSSSDSKPFSAALSGPLTANRTYGAPDATGTVSLNTTQSTSNTNFGANSSGNVLVNSTGFSTPSSAVIAIQPYQSLAGVGCSASSNTVTVTVSYTAPGGTSETITQSTLSITGNGAVDTNSASTFPPYSIVTKAGTQVTFSTTSVLGSTGCSTTPQYVVWAKAIF